MFESFLRNKMLRTILDNVFHEGNFLLVTDVSRWKARRFEDLHPNNEFRWIFRIHCDQNIAKHVDVNTRRDSSDAK